MLTVGSCFAVQTTSGKSAGGKEYMLTLPGISAPLGFFDPLVRPRPAPALSLSHLLHQGAAGPPFAWPAQPQLFSAPPTSPPVSPPQGFSDSPTFTVSEAKRYREAELTHGRVAMLGALGWLVAEEYHPLFGGVGGASSFARFQAVEGVFPQFWEIVLLIIGIAEAYRISCGYNDPRGIDQIKDDYVPGDLGFDPLGLAPTDDEDALYELKTKELNNGRLAMISIAAFAAQEDVEKQVSIWRELTERNLLPPALETLPLP